LKKLQQLSYKQFVTWTSCFEMHVSKSLAKW
jgi:hypothetical protein